MALADLFHPPSTHPVPAYTSESLSSTLNSFSTSFPNWREAEIALIGCPSLPDTPSYEEAEVIRSQLLGLSVLEKDISCVDLGNMKPQSSVEAFHESMADVIAQLRAHETLAICFGGLPAYSYGQFLGHLEHKGRLTYIHLGNQIHLASGTSEKSFNRNILEYQPSPLFQFTHLGYQQYFVPPQELKWLREQHQTAIRYGVLMTDITETEPYLRDAHMVSFDLSAIRASECPGNILPSPGGFTAVEGCQIARYIGLGQELESVQLTGYNPKRDPHQQGALLVAMMIWYIMLGRSQRGAYQTPKSKSKLRRYTVQLHAGVEAINFFQHVHTNRWWMEVPFQEDLGTPKPKSLLVPCSKREYEIAQQDQIPEKWWTIYNKLI